MVKGQLIFIGLGLYNEQDITLYGFEELKKCDKVFAEFYTSNLIGLKISKFEKLIGKKIKILSREQTERGELILDAAENNNVGFLVCGDPMIATTHIDLRLRAIKKEIKTKIIHNGSIVTAAPGLLGLQNYKFGRTTTLAFPENNYFPTSPYEVMSDNKKMGLHTLVLLDIKDDKKLYMTANQGLDLLLEMEKKLGKNIISYDSIACVVARAGSPDLFVKADKIENLKKQDFGPPLHAIVIPGKLHFMELEALEILADLPKEIVKKMQKL